MINNQNKGFTLMEMLVASAVFGILMVAIVGLFVSALRTERSILASKKVLGQISYVTEYMTRALRMAEKDTTGACIAIGTNYRTNPPANDRIKFINALQGSSCQEFFLENRQIKFNNGSNILELTSPDITISHLRFELSGESEGDVLQPFVTIYLEAFATSSPVLEVQTSVSQRNPDAR